MKYLVIQIRDKITILVAVVLVADLAMPTLVLATLWMHFLVVAANVVQGPRTRAGQDALIRVEVDLMEATFGCDRDLNIETAVACEMPMAQDVQITANQVPAKYVKVEVKHNRLLVQFLVRL
jgi:uncharacterized membrane protein YciS (DUF1049 family)